MTSTAIPTVKRSIVAATRRALFAGGQLARFTERGLDRTLLLPVANPTDVTFGGRDLDRLYVTSIAAPDSNDTLDGAVLVIDGLGITGRPEPRFALSQEARARRSAHLAGARLLLIGPGDARAAMDGLVAVDDQERAVSILCEYETPVGYVYRRVARRADHRHVAVDTQPDRSPSPRVR